jgi:hypothetical protein
MPRGDAMITTAIRLPPKLIERADALVPRLIELPTYQGMGRVDRSAVLRIALSRGLYALEREAGAPRGPRRRR